MDENNTLILYWKSLFKNPKQTEALTIGANANMLALSDINSSTGNGKGLLRTYLDLTYSTDLKLPLQSPISRATEYVPEISNLITKVPTLSGASVTAFGTDLKKINLKVTLIKAGTYWKAYDLALQALAICSANPRYPGSLFLFAFDGTEKSDGIPRKYKVVIEKLTPIHRADKPNMVDYDISLIVKYDYSMTPSRNIGQWGNL